MSTDKAHWGCWVSSRCKSIGFRRQRDLALAVRCRPEVISRWVRLSEPPSRMLKGFDAALARALKTDRATLFGAYRKVAPEDAPIVDECGSPVADESRRRIAAVAELLPADELRAFARFGEQLLHGQHQADPAA